MKTLLSFFSPSTAMQKRVPLQDSITTWQFIGISLSRSLGEDSVVTSCPLPQEPEVVLSYSCICIAEPLEAIVRKNFFLDLKLPYFAVRGEQLEIKVLIYNDSPTSTFVSC